MDRVTACIVNFNGEKYLKEAIVSIRASDYPSIHILLVDDASTDNSVSLVETQFPDVEIVRMEENERFLGRYPLANRVRRRALIEARSRWVFLMDNDIVLAPDCLSILLDTMRQRPDCGVCTPRVLYKENKDRIFLDGTELHYLGGSILINRGKSAKETSDAPRLSLGCGIQLVDREKAEDAGYPDGSFVVGWGDDGEFHHRMNLFGYRCYHVPKARVYHPERAGGFRTVAQVKNRWHFILETYAWRSLILLAFPLFIYEFCFVAFILYKNRFKEYILSIQDVISHLNAIHKKRKIIQNKRVLPDAEFMKAGDLSISDQALNHQSLRKAMIAINHFFNLYWRAIRRFI